MALDMRFCSRSWILMMIVAVAASSMSMRVRGRVGCVSVLGRASVCLIVKSMAAALLVDG